MSACCSMPDFKFARWNKVNFSISIQNTWLRNEKHWAEEKLEILKTPRYKFPCAVWYNLDTVAHTMILCQMYVSDFKGWKCIFIYFLLLKVLQIFLSLVPHHPVPVPPQGFMPLLSVPTGYAYMYTGMSSLVNLFLLSPHPPLF